MLSRPRRSVHCLSCGFPSRGLDSLLFHLDEMRSDCSHPAVACQSRHVDVLFRSDLDSRYTLLTLSMKHRACRCAGSIQVSLRRGRSHEVLHIDLLARQLRGLAYHFWLRRYTLYGLSKAHYAPGPSVATWSFRSTSTSRTSSLRIHSILILHLFICASKTLVLGVSRQVYKALCRLDICRAESRPTPGLLS